MINLLLSDSKSTTAFVWQNSDFAEESNSEFSMTVAEQSLSADSSTVCGV